MSDSLKPFLTTSYVIPGLFIVFVIWKTASRLYEDARIRKLGSRARMRRPWVPFGVDMLYEAIMSSRNDKVMEMWLRTFRKWGTNGNYTAESGIGMRVILTAEPENIKAILATQFKDYGKGEHFRRDWHAFLGNGKSNFTTCAWKDQCTLRHLSSARHTPHCGSAVVYYSSIRLGCSQFQQASSPLTINFGTTLANLFDRSSSRTESAILTSSSTMCKSFLMNWSRTLTWR